MIAYKVFRVIDNKLYSAFEKARRTLHYKEGESMVDPKPDGRCVGLMILLEKSKARAFLSACSSWEHFVLHKVSTTSRIRQDAFGKDNSYSAAEVDELVVGVKIGDNQSR